MLTLGRKMSVQTLQWMQVIIAHIKLACVSIKELIIDPMHAHSNSSHTMPTTSTINVNL